MGRVLYFLHRALVGNDGRAWYGVGIALGLGLLSKYTIATLGPAALAFCILDRRARGWFLRPEPYLAVLIAVILFAPVVYWNYANDWASFRFQGGERFGDDTQFSLHYMLRNILLVATPSRSRSCRSCSSGVGRSTRAGSPSPHTRSP